MTQVGQYNVEQIQMINTSSGFSYISSSNISNQLTKAHGWVIKHLTSYSQWMNAWIALLCWTYLTKFVLKIIVTHIKDLDFL